MPDGLLWGAIKLHKIRFAWIFFEGRLLFQSPQQLWPHCVHILCNSLFHNPIIKSRIGLEGFTGITIRGLGWFDSIPPVIITVSIEKVLTSNIVINFLYRMGPFCYSHGYSHSPWTSSPLTQPSVSPLFSVACAWLHQSMIQFHPPFSPVSAVVVPSHCRCSKLPSIVRKPPCVASPTSPPRTNAPTRLSTNCPTIGWTVSWLARRVSVGWSTFFISLHMMRGSVARIMPFNQCRSSGMPWTGVMCSSWLRRGFRLQETAWLVVFGAVLIRRPLWDRLWDVWSYLCFRLLNRWVTVSSNNDIYLPLLKQSFKRG